ncbi:MAG: hypothetical protein H7288_22965 [Kineosporiaceae bacterium]|nr:hypothetical protein [Aeromicrobium sp.]
MGATRDDELRGLRARAYGPNADIRLDLQAQARLHELEDTGRHPAQPPEAATAPGPIIDPVDSTDEQDPHLVNEVEQRPSYELWRRLARLALAVRGRLAHARRSSVLLGLGLVVIASVTVSALVLVERVQPDPLQVGADQIARLSIDSGYQVPGFLRNIATESDSVLAFDEFYGLRAVIADAGWFSSGGEGECLTIFLVADAENAGSDSFPGQIRGGCAAGPFPAMTQLLADDEGLPEELRSAFPASTGLQFVYDRENQEVLIFAGE